MKTAYWPVRDGYPLPDCEAAWREHGRWTVWSLGLLIGFLPFVIAVGTFFDWLERFVPVPGAVVVLTIGPYFLALIVVGNMQRRFRCPRCGARFNAWGPFGLLRGGISRECYNCGLKKFECPGDSPDDTEPGGIVIRPRH